MFTAHTASPSAGRKRGDRPKRYSPSGTLAAMLVIGFAAVAGIAPRGQTQTFRSTVDLVAVEVQVLDASGVPVAGLGPADFRVSIAGKPREVTSAIRVGDAPELSQGGSTAPSRPTTMPAGRVF